MISRNLPLIMFVVAVGIIIFFAGFAVWHFEVFPYPQILSAKHFVEDWKSELGIGPTKLLVSARDPNRTIVRFYSADRLAPGNVLISGLIRDKNSLYGVGLFDRDGKRLHYWPIDPSSLTEKTDDRSVFDVFPHGVLVRPDGTLFVNFDDMPSTVRVSACGEQEWAAKNGAHHAIFIDHENQIWTLLQKSAIGVIDANTGEIEKSISISQDVIIPHNLHGHFDLRTTERELDPDDLDEIYWFHMNDVEIVSPIVAEASSVLEVGDAVVSLREINTILAFDPESGMPRWWQTGPWHRQHDLDLQSGGTIVLFDNNMGKGVSRILRFDPVSREVEVMFEGSDAFPFYSWRRGKQDLLENGNLLVTVSEEGRVLEVSSKGELLWEFNLIFDDDRNGIINKAMILTESYFDAGALDCGNN